MKRQYDRFSLSLEASEDRFTKFPTPFQKEWMLGRGFREFADDLDHLDALSGQLVPGIERPPIGSSWEDSKAALDAEELVIQGQQVMQSWERPLMQRMAAAVARLCVSARTARQRAEVLASSMDAAALDLAAERARFEVGRSTNFDVLRRQEEVAQVQLGQARARVDEVKATAALAALSGRILDLFGVNIR